MIFVCTGSRKFQFDRLIKKLDELVSGKCINDEIFAQIAETKYLPRAMNYCRYLSSQDFKTYQERASLIISHGGTGALVGALKLKKNIIAVPRLSIYGEHSDDHQIQIVSLFEKQGYLRAVYDMNDMLQTVIDAQTSPIIKEYRRESNVAKVIEAFIDSVQ